VGGGWLGAQADVIAALVEAVPDGRPPPVTSICHWSSSWPTTFLVA